MFDQDYSKKVWIIGIVMAVGCLLMDLYIILISGHSLTSSQAFLQVWRVW